MKYSLSASMFTLMLAVVLFASCATKAPSPAQTAPEPTPTVAEPTPKAEPVPEKVAKERTVVVKVPVLVKESSFYSDGLPDAYSVYKLDAEMKNVVERDNFDASRAEPVQRLVSEYKEGRLSAETIYESDGRIRNRRELGYNAAGLLAKEVMTDAKGKPQSSSAYAYDSQGRKTEWRVLDGSGTVKATSSYTYGPSGLTAVTMKDLGGKVTGTIKLEYQGGRLAKRSYFGADSALQKFESYVYSGDQLQAVEYHRADGSLASKTANSYGPLGELAKSVDYSASGTAGNYSTYEYQVREDSKTETYYE